MSQTTISIRRSLLTNLIAIVLVLGVAILAMTFVGSRGTLRRFSQSLIDQIQTISDMFWQTEESKATGVYPPS